MIPGVACGEVLHFFITKDFAIFVVLRRHEILPFDLFFIGGVCSSFSADCGLPNECIVAQKTVLIFGCFGKTNLA